MSLKITLLAKRMNSTKNIKKLLLGVLLIMVFTWASQETLLSDGGSTSEPSRPSKSHHDKLSRSLSNKVSNFTISNVNNEVTLHSESNWSEIIPVKIFFDGSTERIYELITDSGGTILLSEPGVIYANTEIDILSDLSSLTNVHRIRSRYSTIFQTVVSQGYEIHNADAWQNLGYTGTGIKIGIIDMGFLNYSDLMGSELPSTVTARCYTGVTSYTSSVSDCETNLGTSNKNRHGTAVAEAIYDMAPDAEFYISSIIHDAHMRYATDWMISQGVDVINMSLGQSINASKGDGTSALYESVLNGIDDAVENGIVWINAAGNEAKSMWYGTNYHDVDADGWIEIHHDEYLTNPVEQNCMSLSNGQEIIVSMRWDDDWPSATTDLDIYLLRIDSTSSSIVKGSDYPQNGGSNDYPSEIFIYEASSSGQYCLGIVDRTPDKPASWVQVQVFGEDLDIYGQNLSYDSSYTIGSPGESSNPGMLAVGATDWQSNTQIESFSSRGPTADGRIKPDIVGVDDARSSTWGSWLGTSQSSPHVAGLAALIRQAFPTFTPDEVTSYLKQTATPRGESVPNNIWGYGLAHLPDYLNISDMDDLQTIEGQSLQFETSYETVNISMDIDSSIDWGDGQITTGAVRFESDKGIITGSHVYDDDGVYSVVISLTDETSQTVSKGFTVTVANAVPVITMPDFGWYEESRYVARRATFTDSGTSDTHTAQIDWGDGTITPSTIKLADSSIGGNHIYQQPGTYTVTISVTDDDGGVGYASTTVVVPESDLAVPINIPSTSIWALSLGVSSIILISILRYRRNKREIV